MNKFKVGDCVKCINTLGYAYITLNKVYKILGFFGDRFIILTNDKNEDFVYYRLHFIKFGNLNDKLRFIKERLLDD